MRVLGIDPDLHHAGVALVDDGKKLVAVRCPVVSSNFRGAEAAVEMARSMELVLTDLFQTYGKPDTAIIEGQDSYLGSKVKPLDLLHLALSAGVAIGIVRACWSGPRIECPKPVTWKGTVPKHIHQKRILRSLGIAYVPGETPTRILKLPEVDGMAEIKKSHLIHVIDAMGLAVWGSTL